MFDFSIVTNWIHQMLTSFMPEGLAVFLECVVIGVCIILMYAVLAIILIYMERKICAFFQCRLGPMRVGKWGLLQVPCDVIKMLTKEIIDLKFSDRFLYNLAPFMVIIASFLTFACLPVSKGLARPSTSRRLRKSLPRTILLLAAAPQAAALLSTGLLPSGAPRGSLRRVRPSVRELPSYEAHPS